MKALRTGFSILLPMLVIGGLWILAEDRQQDARFEHAMRFVPGQTVVLNQAQPPLPMDDTLVDLGADFLNTYLPASL